MNFFFRLNFPGSFSKLQLIALVFVAFTISTFAQAPVISYQTPQTYILNSSIAPLSPTNTGGAVPATTYGQVSTYAGGGSYLLTPTGIAIDAAGNMFIESWGTNQILKRDPAGAISIFAGTFSQGSTNGQGTAASFYEPDAIVIDAAGNLIIADQGNNLIRKITPGGLVSTFAGSGVTGSTNGIGTASSFNSPRGLAIDVTGNLYVADQASNMIRKITSAGVVTTYAGTGASGSTNGTAVTASFNSPCGVALDLNGNLYVGDSGNNSIRKITPAGVISTFATGFNFPRELRVDGTGNLYVCDQQSNTIKRVSPAGIVTNLAGTGQLGSTNGNSNVATFYSPIGLLLDGNGNLFIGDAGTNLVRKIIVSGYTIDKPLPAGLSFDVTTGIITGTPTALSPATDYTITAYNGGGSSSTIVNIQVLLTIPLKPSIITFPVLTNPIIDANNNVVPGATSTNNETPITYTSSNTAVATITANGLIHLVGPGISIITASQSGNTNYSPATSVTETLTVTESQVITFPTIATKIVCDTDFNVGATSYNATIPITYTSSNTAVATISPQGVIHILTSGTSTITANQAGNNLYTPAPPKSHVLTVTAPIVPLVSVSPNLTSVCTGTSVTYTAAVSNVSNNLSYQWQVNGVNAGTNSNTLIYIPLVSTDAVKCTVTNTASCNAVGVSNIYTGIAVNPYLTPVVTIATSQTAPVCSGTAITYTATSTGAASAQAAFNWKVNGITTATNSATFTSSSLADGDIISCLVNYTGYACFTSSPSATSNTLKASVLPLPNPAPSVTITTPTNNAYLGTTITFTAIPANAGSTISYQWKRNTLNVGTNSTTYSSSILSNGDIITCTITTAIACAAPAISDNFVVALTPPPAVKIPNTFTPNGDGFNDSWNIANISAYPNCLVSVYGRNGDLLYYSRGYNSAWDGSSKGKPLPVSTYYYVIELGYQNTKLSGWVAIIK